MSTYGVESLPCYLGNRVAFEDSILNGQSVLEYVPDLKAQQLIDTPTSTHADHKQTEIARGECAGETRRCQGVLCLS